MSGCHVDRCITVSQLYRSCEQTLTLPMAQSQSVTRIGFAQDKTVAILHSVYCQDLGLTGLTGVTM